MSAPVGLVGWGAIGRSVGEALVAGQVPGLRLVGVTTRSATTAPSRPVPSMEVDELVERSDIVVEAAGRGALRSIGTTALDAGCELVVVSTGALADDDLHRRLVAAGGGRRLHLCAGAIGGLDILAALRASDALGSVTLTTTKPSRALVRDDTDDELRERLRGTEPVVCFDGSARDAAESYPESLNVAATLAVTAGSWDHVRVRLVADPRAERNRHVVELDGPLGHHRIEMVNTPSATNPRTSGLVAASVLGTLDRLARRAEPTTSGRSSCASPA